MILESKKLPTPKYLDVLTDLAKINLNILVMAKKVSKAFYPGYSKFWLLKGHGGKSVGQEGCYPF